MTFPDAYGAPNEAGFFDRPVLLRSHSYFLYGVLAECCQQGISAEICIIQNDLLPEASLRGILKEKRQLIFV